MIINVESQRVTSSPSSEILFETSLMNNKMSRSPYTSYTTTPLGVGGNTEYSTGGGKNNSGGFRLRYLGHGRNSERSHLYCEYYHFKGHTKD